MGKPAISYLMDKQTEISLAYCPRCGGKSIAMTQWGTWAAVWSTRIV